LTVTVARNEASSARERGWLGGDDGLRGSGIRSGSSEGWQLFRKK
jgi:hypothetical protein